MPVVMDLAKSHDGDLVGRGGLEPATSAMTGPERCAYKSGKASVGWAVMWPHAARVSGGRKAAMAVARLRWATCVGR